VDNGYGGQVGYEYETVDYFTHPITGLDQYGTEIIVGQCGTEGADRYRVATRTITPTLGGQPAVYQYAYTPAFDPGQDFRGHPFVDVTAPTGDVTAYTFSLGKYDPATRPDCTLIEAEEPKWGRPLQVTVFDGGQQLSNVETDYAVVETASGVHFIAPATITTTLAGAPSTVITYTYNADTAQVTAIGEWGFADDPDDGRITTIDYAYTWAGIHTLPDRVQVREEAGGLLAETDYHYLMLRDWPVGAIASASITRTDVVSGVHLATEMGYDDYGNMDTYRTGPDGTFSIEYEALHHTFPFTVTYPVAGAETARYDPATGLPESVTDLNGNTTSYDYDGFGRLETLTEPHPDYPTGVQTGYTYSDLNQAATTGLDITVTQAANTLQPFVTTTKYDGLGRLVQEARPGATGWIYTRREYDGLDRPLRVSLPYTTTPSAWSETTYDALGRPETVSAPGADITTYQYDGATVRVIDANQHVKEYDLTAFGAAAVTREYTGTAASPVLYATTLYGYDPLGNLTRITDDQNHTTLIGYDGLSRKISMADPDMGHWRYEYDAEGNLWRQTDARGVVTTLSFDALDRLTGKSYDTSAAPQVAATSPVTYTYDQGLNGKGRRTGMIDGSGGTSWDYDPAGQVLTETQAIAGQSYVTGYRYDALRSGPNGPSRLERMIYPDGEVVTTTYNTQGLPETVAGDDVYLAHAGYNVVDQPTGWALGGVLTQALSYDPGTFRLNGLTAANAGGATLQSLDLAFDPLGCLDLYTDHLAGFSLDHAYDPLDRLVGVASSLYPQDYNYDRIGNLTRRGGVDLTYADPTRPHAVSATSDGTSYDYDANGNLTTKVLSGGQVVTYTYDAENRLTQVLSDTGSSLLTTTFVYDGDGARVKRETWGGDATVYVGNYYTIASASTSERINTSNGTVETSENRSDRSLSLAVAEDGDTYAVWIDYYNDPALRGVYLRRYNAVQGAWDPVVEVSDSSSNSDPSYPSIAVDPNENIYVLWQAGSESLGENDIYFRRYDATAATWSAVEQVNDEQGSDTQVAGLLTGLTVDAAGNAYATWAYASGGDNGEFVLFDRRPAGGSWGTDVPVSDISSANAIEYLSIANNGQRVGIAWQRTSGHEETILYDQMPLPSGAWGTDQEVYYTVSAFPNAPDMDIDSSNNVHVAWTTQYPFKVQYRRYDAASGQWQPPKDLVTLSGAGDEVTWHSSLDANPQGDVVVAWQRGYGPWFDHCGETPRIYYLERSADSSDWTASQAFDPNVTNGQQLSPEVDIDSSGTIRMIWADARFQCAQGKTTGYDLYGSISSSQGTKHYYAGDQPLATRVDGVLYYTLPDPTGTSLVITKANGDEVGHILYDAYGAVLTSTLSATLTTTLAGSGDMPDPDTGLVYLGDGRWYDPALGRPLQPDPIGGPPALPQALNRYSATPWGAPGVAVGASFITSTGLPLNGLEQSIINASPAGDPIFIAFRDTAAQTALGYAAGKVIEATAWGRLTIATSQSTWYRTIGRTSLNLRPLFQRGGLQPQLGKTFRAYTTLGRVRALGGGRYLAETGQIIDTAGLPASAVVRFASLLGPGLRITGGAGAAFGMSATFQWIEDWNDPYLTPTQRNWRIGVSGLGGLGGWGAGLIATEIAAGAGAGSWAGPIGIITGATVTFVWIVWVQPFIFKEGGLNPERNLASLQD
jgi:RHS repeat-associated protein